MPTLEPATCVYVAPPANPARCQEHHKPTGQDEEANVADKSLDGMIGIDASLAPHGLTGKDDTRSLG